MSDQHPSAAPDDPRPDGGSPYGPGPDARPPYATGPHAGDPYAGQPGPGDPYAQPYPGPSSAVEPYVAQPYPAAPYAAQPHPGQPWAADPYAQPYGGGPQDAYPQAPASLAFSAAAGPMFFGTDPLTGLPWSTKTKATAGLLQLLLPLVGVCGVGRLYAGQIGIGLAQLLGFFLGCALMVVLVGFVVAPAVWLWAVVDGIVLLTTGGRDQFGRLLR